MFTKSIWSIHVDQRVVVTLDHQDVVSIPVDQGVVLTPVYQGVGLTSFRQGVVSTAASHWTMLYNNVLFFTVTRIV